MTAPRRYAMTYHRRSGGQRAGTRREDARSAVPDSLAVGAAWSWRLLLVGIAIYAAIRVLVLLSLAVIPLVAALLLAASEYGVGCLHRCRRVSPIEWTWPGGPPGAPSTVTCAVPRSLPLFTAS